MHSPLLVTITRHILSGTSRWSRSSLRCLTVLLLLFVCSRTRWKKWKLKGEKIDKLTSTASPAATAALQLLETCVTNMRFFARGKRGVLYAGEMCSSYEPVVAKLAASASCTASVTLEAQWLRVVNRMGLGPKLLDAGAGWFLCERLPGKNVVEFLAQADEAVSPANAVWVVREMLCQVRRAAPFSIDSTRP